MNRLAELAPTGRPISLGGYIYDVVDAATDAAVDSDEQSRRAVAETASFLLSCATLGVAVMDDGSGHPIPLPFPKGAA